MAQVTSCSTILSIRSGTPDAPSSRFARGPRLSSSGFNTKNIAHVPRLPSLTISFTPCDTAYTSADMPVPEDDILKAIEPSITNSNDYPEFTLHDARIVYEGNGKPANLLVAYADTPLRVTGRLDPPKREQSRYCAFVAYMEIHVRIRGRRHS